MSRLVATQAGSDGIVLTHPCPFALDCLPAVLDVATIARRLRRDKQGGVVEIVLWNTLHQKYMPDYFWRAGAASLGLSADDQMLKSTWHTSGNGVETTRYTQRWHGIRVADGGFVLTTVNHFLVSGQGQLATHIAAATTASVPDATALATAMTTQQVTWVWVADPSQPVPKPTLEIYSPDFGATKPFALVWTLELRSTSDQFVVRIDATTGAVVQSESEIVTGTEVTGTGTTVAGKTVRFTDTREDASYRLREQANRQIATERLDGKDFSQASNSWTDASVRPAVSAHWAVERYWDWLASSFGRAGLNGDKTVEVQIEPSGDCGGLGPHFQPPGLFDRSLVIRLCGLPRFPGPPIVDPFVLDHELTHVLANSIMGASFAQLTDPRAIREGIADALGAAANAATTGTVSWVVAPGTPYARHLDDPASFGEPSQYNVSPWDPSPTADPHENGLVIGHWFYLLWSSISPSDAARVLYESIHSMTPTMSLVDLREVTIKTAENLPGFSADEPDAIGSAWDRVNVLDPLAGTINHYPQDGQEDVLPWNLQVSFDMPIDPKSKDEDQWRVEISTTSDFSSDVRTEVYSRMHAPAFYLDAITHYYWRVKAHHSSDGHWDKASAFKSEFETSRAAPSSVEPVQDKKDVGAWPVTFSWKQVFGADKYEVELADDHNMTDHVRRAQTTATSLTLYARPGMQQYWRVRAGHGSQLGDWSTRFQSARVTPTLEESRRRWSSTDALTFTADEPTPDLVAPAKDATVSPWAIAFSWSNIHADDYDVEITKSGGSADSYPPIGFGNTNDKTLSEKIALHMQQAYSWRVRGRRAGDTSAWSKTGPFKTDDARVKFTAPANGASVCPWPAVTKWNAVPGAIGYQEDFARDNDNTFSAPLMNTGSADHPVTESSDTLLALLPGHTYYWRVRAFGPGGELGAWSNAAGASTQTFHPDDCTRPKQISPINQQVADPLQVQLQWGKVIDDRTTYRYRITRVTPPASNPPPPWVENGAQTEANVPTHLDYNTEYTWFVQAERGSAGGSGWSTYQVFDTMKPPPKCGPSVTQKTGIGASYRVDVGKPGEFLMSYDLQTVDDQVVIRDSDQNGRVLWDTGCTNGTGSQLLYSTVGRVNVQVVAHCDEVGGETTWEVTIGCAK